jgi:hypothetical protein
MDTQELISLGVVAFGGYYLYANKQINQTQALYIAIFLVVIYFLFIRDYMEGNTNVSAQLNDTIFVSENAFTGLDCVSENLPIFRFKQNDDKSETIRCLINPDTNACYNKGEFFAPGTEPSCNKFQETLVKEIRDTKSNARKVFNASNPWLVHECSAQGLKTPGHWCNTVYSELAKTDCSDKFISGKLANTCNSLKNVNAFLQAPSTTSDSVIPLSFKSGGKPCNQVCLAAIGANPINPDKYDCMMPSRRGRIPDPDCEGTKARNRPLWIKYNNCLTNCGTAKTVN